MKSSIILNLAFAGCIAGLLAGCASTEVTNRERLVYEKLPRPDNILVYNFSSSPADVPADSALAGQAAAPEGTTTAEQAALGRELGSDIAAQLVAEIREMGLPATQISTTTTPQVNDIVIRGYLVSIEQGSTTKRMTLGFGSGGSELTTVIEGYQMTAGGLRKLGSGTMGAEGSKGPGMAVGGAAWLITGSPVGLIVGGGMKVYGEASGSSKVEGRAKQSAKEIADLLKKRFKEEGWIN
ncbi:MAG TPA: DUF4410 domain-containing protein [Verrucomicrobiae bacterium]|nr:DUF4410 domain-containing protein [Verrucomicrobiae bacterium]